MILDVFLGVLLGFSVAAANGLDLWPMPKSVSYGSESLQLSSHLELKTEGSKYSDGSGILRDGFLRILDVIKADRALDGPRASGSINVLAGLHVVLLSDNDTVRANFLPFVANWISD